MNFSSVVIFIFSCCVLYILGNSFINFIGRIIKKIKSKRQSTTPSDNSNNSNIPKAGDSNV